MLSRLKTLLGMGPRKRAPLFDAPLNIDKPTYAIGDVHGRHDLLVELLDMIAEDAEGRGFSHPRIVLLGDYVDRGEQSARALAHVRDLLDGDGDVEALRGNHEDMMLAFIDEPERAGPRWLRNGGLQTLASYGVGGVIQSADTDALADAARRLEAAAADVLPLLRRLRTWTRHGDVLFSHAGFDPDLPPTVQSENALIWGAPRFLQIPRQDGLWCVYGHYVVDEAGVAQGRVAVDTGAYHTGRLSAALLADGAVEFLST